MEIVSDHSPFARGLAARLDTAIPFWSRVTLLDVAARSPFEALGGEAGPLPGPIAVVAGTCPQFHGFHGRTWEARPGNLHLTAAIPIDCATQAAVAFTVFPALAARDGIIAASRGAVRPAIKWVNDLYVDGGKAAGVITRTHIQGGRTQLIVTGIGVNVACAPDIRTSPFVPGTASVPGVDLAVLLVEILTALEHRCRETVAGRVEPLLAAYRDASNVIGRRARIYSDRQDETLPPSAWPPPLAAGTVRTIEDDLSLRLDDRAQPVSKGRLAFEDDCRHYGLPPL